MEMYIKSREDGRFRIMQVNRKGHSIKTCWQTPTFQIKIQPIFIEQGSYSVSCHFKWLRLDFFQPCSSFFSLYNSWLCPWRVSRLIDADTITLLLDFCVQKKFVFWQNIPTFRINHWPTRRKSRESDKIIRLLTTICWLLAAALRVAEDNSSRITLLIQWP